MEPLLPEEVDASEPVEDVHAAYLVEGDRMSAQQFEMEPGP